MCVWLYTYRRKTVNVSVPVNVSVFRFRDSLMFDHNPWSEQSSDILFIRLYSRTATRQTLAVLHWTQLPDPKLTSVLVFAQDCTNISLCVLLSKTTRNWNRLSLLMTICSLLFLSHSARRNRALLKLPARAHLNVAFVVTLFIDRKKACCRLLGTYSDNCWFDSILY